ncbi:uncharacterized protein LOC131223669 isoform X2 [Magnolia sinica]|uniref:uncharacterized protein LOC131223669 isoform X2 n=1 Tax=Magnolia sinica TaxID=86752 RepID=UPI002657F207|nr:uncharacterized protein LOC131223669 isoform X2 [Magnolia sinica]
MILCFLLASLILFSSAEPFDVRSHLSTASRYDAVKGINNNGFVASPIPAGCSVIHLNLVARHGTRSPTRKRIKELDRLATKLEVLLSDAKQKAKEGHISLQKIPDWLWGWQSPWKGKETGGELVSKGEEELYHLGIRTRERFPDLFQEEYHPDIFPIRATQVPRASASAVAFGMGLFSGKGSLGPGKHRAFAVISESRASDIYLRFHDTCENYKEYRRSQEPAVDKLKEPIFEEVSSTLATRLQLNFTSQDVASLWFLCKQEASLLDITDQACSLFSPDEVALLEWTDDLEAFLLKGYGNSINYHMGVPLLQDVVRSMELAIAAKEENLTPGSSEKARLRFAHAETLIPFTCLLGLFREGSEFERIQRMQPLEPPLKPPQKRNWRGSILAPFAGNNMLVLYGCPGNESKNSMSSGVSGSKYFVQVLHNEVPVPVPVCGNKDFFPFEDFKERIVNAYLEHNFDSLCNKKLEPSKVESLVPHPVSCKFSKYFRWLFMSQDDESHSDKHKTEL